MNFSTESLQFKIYDGQYSEVDNSFWNSVNFKDKMGRLYYITYGKGVLEIDGSKIDIEPNNIYMIPPHTLHSYSCFDHLHLFWIHFSAFLSTNISLFYFYSYLNRILPENNNFVRKMFESIVRLHTSSTPSDMLNAHALCQQLLALFFDLESDFHVSDKFYQISEFKRVIDYIHNNLSKKIDVDELAEIAGYQTNYFSTKFKRVFSISPSGYIKQSKIEAAQSRLKYSDARIEEIADELAYSDVFHFSKTFKACTGMSPSKFRGKYLKDGII